MLKSIKEQIVGSIEFSLKETFSSLPQSPVIELEVPSDKKHGEYSTNIALKSAKILKKPPLEIAGQFREKIEKGIAQSSLKEKVEKIEVKNPGFINFYLSTGAVYDILAQILKEKDTYGTTKFGGKKKIQIEFVSANPTGPLSVAHARQAAIGDALANILSFIGFDMQEEYYVNDEGNQIHLLGESISCRCQELLGEAVQFPEEGYQGDYVKNIAQEFLTQHHIDSIDKLKKIKPETVAQFGVDCLLNVIKKDLEDFGVHFDNWAHQSKIATVKQIEKVLGDLKKKGVLYEKDGALWFKSTDYKDDKDRVVKKSDGTYTYLAPDIVYHKDKFDRGFKEVVNIWGPDHHGYIPRLQAAVEVLGHKDALKVLIIQLATIYRKGKPVSMSTRRGEFVSLREVIDEVGVDAARFFFLLRHINVHLDFDLDLAKQQTAENPVYYIQYAHARIHSIIKKAKEENMYKKAVRFQLLKEEEELDLIKKIGSFPDILLLCRQQMDPYALANYLLELATCFHKFYDRHRVVDAANLDLSAERFALIDAVRIVLANGLRLLGVSTPEKM